MTRVVDSATIEERIQDLIEQMTLEEKVGQLTLANAAGGHVPDWLRDDVVSGRTGSVLNEVDLDTVNELQRLAVEESRLGSRSSSDATSSTDSAPSFRFRLGRPRPGIRS